MRVLVVRNDKVGDFMLAWPALSLLKSAQCHVSVLVPRYTEELARACPFVDQVLIDPSDRGSVLEQSQLLDTIRQNSFDASLTLYSTWRIGVLLRKAGIAYRLAPASKFAQILHNRREVQRRSRSLKPEWEYNLDLAARLLRDHAKPISYVTAPYWSMERAVVTERRDMLSAQLELDRQTNRMMVHVGSGGSANHLSLLQYEQLLVQLAARLPNWVFILSAGPNEQAAVGGLLAKLINARVPVAMLVPNGLVDFACSIAACDAFMAGSTGPLHIAGALDVPTIGFYTKRRSATALRWQTLNTPGHRLAVSPNDTMPNPERFDGMDIDAVAMQIAAWLSKLTV
jgi:ADP-heptose:LPS heptosyltransferase